MKLTTEECIYIINNAGDMFAQLRYAYDKGFIDGVEMLKEKQNDERCEEKRVIPGIPPKRKYKSKWMNGFSCAKALTDMDHVERHRIYIGLHHKHKGSNR